MITGQFSNRDGYEIKLTIDTGGEDIILGTTPGYWFSGSDPIIITMDNDDTFQEIIKTTCSINLLVNKYIPNVFTAKDRDIKVHVEQRKPTRENPNVEFKTLFFGYITPLCYDQPYEQEYTQITITAEDYLCTIENHKYQEEWFDEYGFANYRPTNVSFKDILNKIGFGFEGDEDERAYQYIVKTDPTLNWIDFEQFKISELIILGSSEDSVKTYDDILCEICKFFNMHVMIKDKNIAYFFTYDYKQGNNKVEFRDYVRGKDTKLSVDAVYNKLILTCDTKEEEQVISSPTDKKEIEGPFNGKQKYANEYYSWGEGRDAQNAYMSLLVGQATDYDMAFKNTYFIECLKSNSWTFNTDSYVDSLNGKNQWKIPQLLNDTPYKCALMNVGSIQFEGKYDDNAPISTVDMSPYLYISINGQAQQDDNGWMNYNQPNKTINQNYINSNIGESGLATFTKVLNGGVLGGTDEETKNYFLFSGNIIYIPKYHCDRLFTGTTSNMNNILLTKKANRQRFNSSKNGDGCFYAISFFNTADSQSKTPDNDIRTNEQDFNLQLYNKDFTFERTDGYSEDAFNLMTYTDAENKDNITKVPVFACTLSVGDMELIETAENVFEWVDKNDSSKSNWVFKDSPNIYSQYKTEHIFSIGFNPKLKDRIFGQEHKIANTVSYNMNLEDEGTAIEIPTGLTGDVKFKIKYPIATVWTANVCVRQPSFWNHSEWANRSCEVLPFCKSIAIKDFSCKLVSDDAGRNNYQEQDLIYMTGNVSGQVGLKDDISFMFNTALTTEQSKKANQNAGPKISNVIYGDLPFTGFNDDEDKAEIRYIESKYEEYSEPRLIISSKLQGLPKFFLNYTMNEPNGTFTPISYEYDALENKTTYKLKEIWKEVENNGGDNPEDGEKLSDIINGGNGGNGGENPGGGENPDNPGEEPTDPDNPIIPDPTLPKDRTLYFQSINPIPDEPFAKIGEIQERGITQNGDYYVVYNEVPNMGNYFMYGITDLTAMMVNEGARYVSLNTFTNCTNLKYISLPNTITGIGNGAFEGCTSLTQISIPDSVTTLQSNVFKNCTSLKNVKLPNSITQLSMDLFANCSSLTQITIPESVSHIMAGAFDNTGLQEIIIPENVTSIGGDGTIFNGCDNLTKISFYCYIESYVPFGAPNVQNLIILLTNYQIYVSSTIEIDHQALGGGIRKTYDIDGGYVISYRNEITEVPEDAFDYAQTIFLKLPKSVTRINDYAFHHSRLQEIIIPETVTYIGENAFGACWNISKIYYSGPATGGFPWGCPNTDVELYENNN